jgi:hypothetical protein
MVYTEEAISEIKRKHADISSIRLELTLKLSEFSSKLKTKKSREYLIGLPLFLVPVVMRVFHTYSPYLEEGGA